MKIGTTGTSFITKLLIESFIRTNNDVVAVSSRDIIKAKKLAEEYNISKYYDSYEMMLEDEDIDTIYIGLPNGLHYEYAKKALLASKNVIVEKAFTANHEQANELYELAISKHLYLFEAILTIHQPIVSKLKEDLKLIEPIHFANFNFSKYSSKYDDFKALKNPNVFNKDMAGGALMDLNIYNLHLIEYLFGRANKYVYYANNSGEIDTSGVAVFKYDNMLVEAIACKDSDAKSRSIIMGENGYIEIDEATSIISHYILKLKDKDEVLIDLKDKDPYDYEILSMMKIIENDLYDEHIKLLEHSLRVMKIVDKLNKATI